MVGLIKEKLNEIRALCKKYHVKSLWLFGSAAGQHTFTPDSDIDFMYRLKKEDFPEVEYADHYFNLWFELQRLLGRKVDLIPEERLKNPYFIEAVNAHKISIYEA